MSNDLDRAFCLVDKYHYPVGQSQIALHITPSKYKRARRAMRSGREIGISGHPRKLSNDEEDLLVKRIIDANDMDDPMSVDHVLEAVRYRIFYDSWLSATNIIDAGI